MEKIRSFVENMFLGLPDTQEVRDAKARLLEGMSDRYEELLAQGKDPDAAFGISVAEFGSMEELRRELGGGTPAAAPQPQPCLDEAARRGVRSIPAAVSHRHRGGGGPLHSGHSRLDVPGPVDG